MFLLIDIVIAYRQMLCSSAHVQFVVTGIYKGCIILESITV